MVPIFQIHPLSTAPSDQEIVREFPFLEGERLSRSSLVARYFLLLYLRDSFGYTGGVEKDEQGRPQPITNYEGGIASNETNRKKEDFLYWSLSHSSDRVAFAVSTHPIGIDIEAIIPRDPSILSIHREEEYERIRSLSTETPLPPFTGGSYTEVSRWSSFYLLWTAKEAILKIIPDMNLDWMRGIQLQEVESAPLGGSKQSRFLFAFRGEIYRVEMMMVEGYGVSWAMK